MEIIIEVVYNYTKEINRLAIARTAFASRKKEDPQLNSIKACFTIYDF